MILSSEIFGIFFLCFHVDSKKCVEVIVFKGQEKKLNLQIDGY